MIIKRQSFNRELSLLLFIQKVCGVCSLKRGAKARMSILAEDLVPRLLALNPDAAISGTELAIQPQALPPSSSSSQLPQGSPAVQTEVAGVQGPRSWQLPRRLWRAGAGSTSLRVRSFQEGTSDAGLPNYWLLHPSMALKVFQWPLIFSSLHCSLCAPVKSSSNALNPSYLSQTTSVSLQ